jgi:hypothetical protein
MQNHKKQRFEIWIPCYPITAGGVQARTGVDLPMTSIFPNVGPERIAEVEKIEDMNRDRQNNQ